MVYYINFRKRKDTIMTNLQITKTDKNLAEIIAEDLSNDMTIVLCTQITKNEEIVKSITLSKAKIDEGIDFKDYSKNNWADIANAMNDLSKKNLYIANLNEMSVESVIAKCKKNDLKIKNILIDDIENLISNDNYKKLKSFFIETGARIIACNC